MMNELEPETGEEAVEAPEVVEVPREDIPAKEWSDDEEFEAKALGWKAPDDWKGDKPPGYIADPREYLRRAETFGPFRKIKEKLERLEDHTRRIESVTAKQVERAQKQAEAEFNQRLNAIQAEKRKAAQEGDLERYDQLAATEARLERPKLDTVPPVEPPKDTLTEEVKAKHTWVNDAYLRRRGAELVDEAFGTGELPRTATPQEQVVFVEGRLKAYYPHLFQPEQKPVPKASPVDGGGIASARRTGFSSLPQDAKDAFKRLVAQGVFKDTDEDRKFYHDEYSAN
jgi:hypothetical protein